MNKEREIVLMNVSGDDKPGLTSSLTAILSGYDVNILDIGQAVIHNHLSLGILFELPEIAESSVVLKDLLFKSYELGITVKFTPIKQQQYSNWVVEQGKDRYIISVLGRKITSLQLAKVSKIIFDQNLNIDMIVRLSGRIPLDLDQNRSKSCVEFSISGHPINIEEMKSSFMAISREINVDIAFQEDTIYRRNRRLVCFDMDSTLIETEVIVELAKYAGVEDKVHELTEAAMRGELNFKDSFRERLALLKGIDEKVLHEIAVNLPISEGAEKLISTLKKYGYKTAILSGGVTYFGRYLQTRLGVDYVYANELEIVDGKLTGNYIGEIVDGQMKAELLKKLAFKEDIHLNQVIAVGDGANDLPMLSVAGLGIAYHAKPKVKESAKQAISTIGLDGILYLIGFRDREIS